eukprot:7819754-Alexandrium_andersonii.AAC.1
MWAKLYAVHPSLVWSQSQVEELMLSVEAAVSDKWVSSFTADERTSWKKSLAKQFRAMARAINNGRARRASWLRDVLGADYEHTKKPAAKKAKGE